ncbi:hypothetical protein SDC9_115900 [bioreactor metagenome]|uniref:HTH cro/C1-type domain-containing protein n=1 Tax=bioreactor metagenome TaxID=1076179 RepID=A0A645C0V6_9ZZZZ
MDCQKVGGIILALRKENGFTQKELADKLGVSDKAVSKWERGLGCPDISLLSTLSDTLGVNISEMLSGNLGANDINGGNMKRLKFYVCKNCGNIVTATESFDGSCCGRKFNALEAKPADTFHQFKTEIVDDEYYLTMNHEMTKEHYISFVAYVTCDRVLFVKLYPEQNAELHFPRMRGGKFYFYCSKDGLFALK